MKIGIVGVGHLGKIHIKCTQLIPEYTLVGFYDTFENNALYVEQNFNLKRFHTLEDLFEAVDIVDIVTPTTTHFEIASMAIRAGKHIFIEKPVTENTNQALELLKLAAFHQVKVQVGHVERFNPALLAIKDLKISPMFLEVHRLATFNPRGTDVSVVLDLMIHDLDIVLKMVNSPVKKIDASGVAIVSELPDIANARVEFENGCVANITASRMSLKQMRKIRLFQSDAYISLDLLDKKTEIVKLHDDSDVHPDQREEYMLLETQKGNKYIELSMPEIEPVNAIKEELDSFRKSILLNIDPEVTLQDGYYALQLAEQISDQIQYKLNQISS